MCPPVKSDCDIHTLTLIVYCKVLYKHRMTANSSTHTRTHTHTHTSCLSYSLQPHLKASNIPQKQRGPNTSRLTRLLLSPSHLSSLHSNFSSITPSLSPSLTHFLPPCCVCYSMHYKFSHLSFLLLQLPLRSHLLSITRFFFHTVAASATNFSPDLCPSLLLLPQV